MIMSSPVKERAVIYIRATVESHSDIADDLLAIHGLSAGLEINILRQWTTGPPALRIWWSGLKSGGPESYV